MKRKMPRALLTKAKANKRDEFYTQLIDIESELKHYESHFAEKVVYCNCDDPRSSNFFRYFSSNFSRLRLKKVIAACYKCQEGDLFAPNVNGPAIYLESESGDISPDLVERNLKPFKGDGDFRSSESISLLMQSDVVVTNPPFSLFREYVAQLIRHNKKFLIIGNINAITYKEIFGLIKENRAWLGINLGRGVSGFIVPEHYELYGTEAEIDASGNRIISPNNCLWLTNLDTFKRHEDIPLTKRYLGNESNYPKYDNYDAINVDKTQDIPMDYDGFMGVPITFLHKFNPEQFELIRFRKGHDDNDLSINGKCPYFRIIVRNRKPVPL
ncbi:MAG: adenosine deaminase [Deltaproteobacteria bacterium]|nr:adenosine deaminase [Deltaproteobacteria bacterium]